MDFLGRQRKCLLTGSTGGNLGSTSGQLERFPGEVQLLRDFGLYEQFGTLLVISGMRSPWIYRKRFHHGSTGGSLGGPTPGN